MIKPAVSPRDILIAKIIQGRAFIRLIIAVSITSECEMPRIVANIVTCLTVKLKPAKAAIAPYKFTVQPVTITSAASILLSGF